jgi:hypothetical protein
MRFITVIALAVLASTPALACEIAPQTNLVLEEKDQAVLISLGKAVDAQVVLKGAPVAALFSQPPGVLALNETDAKTLAQALSGLGKGTACHADGVTMERLFEGDTPGIKFIRQLEGCLADACVNNK